MNDAFGMSAIERAANLLDDDTGVLGRELSLASQYGAQILAVDEFHADETNAIRLTQIENADHVLVRDVARENQFLLEAGQNGRIRSQFGADDLERDQAVEFAVT